MNNIYFRVCWLILLFIFPWLAYTAGLGKLTHSSFLGQPFKAEIELVSIEKDEIPSLTARLASPEVFHQAGVTYAPYHSSLSVSIEKRVNGQPYIQITSPQLVDEPFVNLLIELNGSSGRLLREYTVLLDPADTQTATPVNQVIQHTPDLPKTAFTTAEVIQPQIKTGQKPITHRATSSTSNKQGRMIYGPVVRGETLTRIAKKVTPEGVDLNQMLVALYQANQNAFLGKNMNLLKVGAILRIPNQNEVLTISQVEVSREIGSQAANWHVNRQKLADAAMGFSSKPKAEVKTSAARRISATVPEENSVVKKTLPEEVLILSKGEQLESHQTESLNGEKNSAGQDYLRMMEEDAIAKDRALTEANERVALLEQNIERLQRLLEIKGAGMTDAQTQAVPALTPTLVEPAATETTHNDSRDITPIHDINRLEPSETAVSEPSAKQTVNQVLVPHSSESIEATLLDQIVGFVSDDLELAGGVLIVLLTSWLSISMLRRSRGRGHNMDDDVFDYPEEATKSNVKASHKAKSASTETMILDEMQAARKKEMTSEFPQNPKFLKSEELKGNLSESASGFFFGKNLSEGFVIDRDTGSNHDHVKIELDPSEDISAKQDSETKFDLENINHNSTFTSIDRLQNANEAEMFGTKKQSISSHELAMNLEMKPTDKKDPSYSDNLKSSNSMASLDKGESLSVQGNTQLSKLNLALADIKLDMKDELGKAIENGVTHDKDKSTSWNEAAVKIDLAKAYLEMEDKEVARRILEEVVHDGNQEQQAVAKSLLEDLK
ncbi:FimV/HubP family polar landmark protein [Nitrosomonas communis]|uniref:Pilus assembly protein FimV n=1 Tax=Nitrosomonas communis TaxID=44574 RepID=A0A1I4N592_9PROT|nr:FimV/HubP family polar landmark protein [Nitrosomonas communis]SFM10487.1 pilus assembly protein FimV [Nitrosomonas communis]